MPVSTFIRDQASRAGRAGWRVVETASRRLAPSDVSVRWSETWDEECDAALALLPPIPGCPHTLYRELTSPTDIPKRHAIVSEAGEPIALISLRRRKHFWEPVAYQCLPGVIAPARDQASLVRALRALGVEVRLDAGLDESARNMGADKLESYDVHQADLRGDYEAYWRRKKQRHLWSVRRARSRCEDLTLRINGEGDLAWIVQNWRAAWADTPDQEVVAAPDRERFWSALAATPATGGQWQVRSLLLTQGEERVAGGVFLCREKLVSFQCSARALAFEELSAGTRVLDLAMEWAARQGFETFDLGAGSANKRQWAPVAAKRFGVCFRPPLINFIYGLAGRG